jgi:zinc protease
MYVFFFILLKYLKKGVTMKFFAEFTFLRRSAYRLCSLMVCTFVHSLVQAGGAIEHWQQESGAQVWLRSTSAIPMVDIQIDWDAGARFDPQGLEGLSGFAATMLTKGSREWKGRPALTEEKVGSVWADLGGIFSAQASEDRFFVNVRTLTKTEVLEEVTQLVAHQLAAPAVNDTVWNRIQRNVISSIKEMQTRPGPVAARAFNEAIFLKHPYGRSPSEQSMLAIAPSEIKKFLDSNLRACDAKVSVVGNLSKEQANTMVLKLLAGIRDKPCLDRPSLEKVAPLTQSKDVKIAFDSAQAHLLMGQPGIARSDADYFPIIVGNYILGGGGFVSRLTREVREKRGLSYSVASSFSPARDKGAFLISLQTRPDQVQQAKNVAMDVLRDFVLNGPTQAELKAAKDFMIGGFALNLDSNRKLLNNVSSIAWNGLPLNYLDTWTTEIGKVSTADIRRAFQKNLALDKMVTVVVGGEN